jgi:hypothetical protein
LGPWSYLARRHFGVIQEDCELLTGLVAKYEREIPQNRELYCG